MLHLKTHYVSHSHTRISGSPTLSPVVSEDDELIQAIEADTEEAWQLEATPDTRALDQFWSGVEEDLTNDPQWFSFATDDE